VTLPFGIFLFLVVVARMPSTLSSSLLGNGVLTWTTGQTIIVIAMLAIFITLVVIFRKPITNLLNKFVRTKSKDQDVDITDMME
jgi:ABC-type bacteriocin/lantibiotic exporter with double-glycine peptidase domain